MDDASPLYARLRDRARQIASRYPPAAFYRDHAGAVDASRTLFESDALVLDLRQNVCGRLEDDFGHGLLHAAKVALDAGALMHIEGRAAGYSGAYLARRICMAHCAGLLHDIQRKQTNHAEQGACRARELLTAYPVASDEIEDICIAIRNHEAFKSTVSVNTREGALVSDCLYDADKFRWGPDNFTDTLWAMIAFTRTTLPDFLKHYPAGMASLARIKSTFRTAAGRAYGPGFIDLGIAIGEELYQAIRYEFCDVPV
jgi:hypothetical protein